jgi:hypothetical protein
MNDNKNPLVKSGSGWEIEGMGNYYPGYCNRDTKKKGEAPQDPMSRPFVAVKDARKRASEHKCTTEIKMDLEEWWKVMTDLRDNHKFHNDNNDRQAPRRHLNQLLVDNDV